MATLYIEEYAFIASDGAGNLIQAAMQPSIATQTVAIGAGSVQSAAFNTNTKFVRISPDVTCSYLFGTNPTASATTPRLVANSSEYFGVISGQKVAVITNT